MPIDTDMDVPRSALHQQLAGIAEAASGGRGIAAALEAIRGQLARLEERVDDLACDMEEIVVPAIRVIEATLKKLARAEEGGDAYGGTGEDTGSYGGDDTGSDGYASPPYGDDKIATLTQLADEILPAAVQQLHEAVAALNAAQDGEGGYGRPGGEMPPEEPPPFPPNAALAPLATAAGLADAEAVASMSARGLLARLNRARLKNRPSFDKLSVTKDEVQRFQDEMKEYAGGGRYGR